MTREELLRVPYKKVTSGHMEALRQLHGGRCRRCGGRWSLDRRHGGLKHRPLEFAHLAPTGLNGRGRGLYRRFFDVLRHPECYVLLCKRCHWLLDAQEATARWLAEVRQERHEQAGAA